MPTTMEELSNPTTANTDESVTLENGSRDEALASIKSLLSKSEPVDLASVFQILSSIWGGLSEKEPVKEILKSTDGKNLEHPSLLASKIVSLYERIKLAEVGCQLPVDSENQDNSSEIESQSLNESKQCCPSVSTNARAPRQRLACTVSSPFESQPNHTPKTSSAEPSESARSSKYEKWKEDILKKAEVLGIDVQLSNVSRIEERSALKLIESKIMGKMKMKEVANTQHNRRWETLKIRETRTESAAPKQVIKRKSPRVTQVKSISGEQDSKCGPSEGEWKATRDDPNNCPVQFEMSAEPDVKPSPPPKSPCIIEEKELETDRQSLPEGNVKSEKEREPELNTTPGVSHEEDPLWESASASHECDRPISGIVEENMKPEPELDVIPHVSENSWFVWPDRAGPLELTGNMRNALSSNHNTYCDNCRMLYMVGSPRSRLSCCDELVAEEHTSNSSDLLSISNPQILNESSFRLKLRLINTKSQLIYRQYMFMYFVLITLTILVALMSTSHIPEEDIFKKLNEFLDRRLP